MIALILFSLIAALVVWWAGRRDAALDPALTTLVLCLLAAFPVIAAMLPKLPVLPRVGGAGSTDVRTWGSILMWVWAAGFAFCLVRLVLASRGIARWRTRSVEVGNSGGIEVRMLEGLKGPVAAGVFRKMIFVPADWPEWDGGRRDLVMAHELAHHRRRDPLRRWVAGFAVAVNWFNPLVRWMVDRLLIQCEFACDAEVLKQGAAKEFYAGLLCDLADDSRPRGAALAMAETSGLEARVKRMMAEGREPEGPGASWLMLFAVGMAGLLAILGAERITAYTESEIELRRTADPFPGNGAP